MIFLRGFRGVKERSRVVMSKTVISYLENFCEEVTYKEFYRDIFPKGELEKKGVYEKGKYNGIAVSISDDKRIKRYTITDELDKLDEICEGDDFCLMSPISYIGKSRKSENARFLYALTIDLDGIKQKSVENGKIPSDNGYPIGIANLFYQFDGHGESNYLPLPTYIVASGTGLHLYYVFKKPIPLFKNIVQQLEILKKRLTWQLWTQGVSELQDKVQYESLFQGFRIVGTKTKIGTRARAFLVDRGEKVDIQYLNEFVPEEYRVNHFVYKSNLTLEKAKEKYPEWYEKRIVQKQPKGSWICKRDLYDWWKRKIYDGAEEGHRYWCIMTLATYAIKCGISRKELEQDAMGMIEFLDKKSSDGNPFTVDDVLHALESYNDSYITYPIDTIVARTGIPIEKNKRNGRKQEIHLYLARRKKEDLKMIGELVKEGRPSKKEVVREYLKEHIEATKAEVIRETGLSKPTVYKYYEQIKQEILDIQKEIAQLSKEKSYWDNKLRGILQNPNQDAPYVRNDRKTVRHTIWEFDMKIKRLERQLEKKIED